MEMKISDTVVKTVDFSNPMMQNLQLGSRFNALVEENENLKKDLEDAGSVEQLELEDMKSQTIDVSTYSGAVTITPSKGKDGMRSVKITLTNIPSATQE